MSAKSQSKDSKSSCTHKPDFLLCKFFLNHFFFEGNVCRKLDSKLRKFQRNQEVMLASWLTICLFYDYTRTFWPCSFITLLTCYRNKAQYS